MTLPEGLIYAPGFLTETEERDVLAVLATFVLVSPCVTAAQRVCQLPGCARYVSGDDLGGVTVQAAADPLSYRIVVRGSA